MHSIGKLRTLPKVIYIMGTARSGSTILEVMLSNEEHTFGAGELAKLIQDGFVADKECSCKQPASRCEIWSKIIKCVGLADNELQDWMLLQKRIDWHKGFLRQLLGLVSREDIRAYKRLNCHLLDAIQKVTGSSIVLDSSKYAGRALALNRMMKADVSVICLTRSPIGLMTSFQKPNKDEQKSKSPLNILVYYVLTLGSLRVARWLLGNSVLPLRYEDMLDDPKGILERIEKWSGLDLKESKKAVEGNRPFDVGHIITGNRLRYQGKVIFERNCNHESRLRSLGERLALQVMGLWKNLLHF